jgi:UPF0716 protein FxsA
MLIYLILLFTVLPALELYILIKVGGVIGAGPTILLVILTGTVGAWLARLEGFRVLNKTQQSLNQGVLPSSELLDGLMILVGGIMLLAPGFITDVLGLLLLIPWTRALIKLLVRRKLESMIRQGQVVQVSPFRRREGPFEDIDV